MFINSSEWSNNLIHLWCQLIPWHSWSFQQSQSLIENIIEIVIFLFVLKVRYVIPLSSVRNIQLLYRSLFNTFYHHSFIYLSCVALFHDYQTLCQYWRESRNLNSISAQNFIKSSLLRAHISVNKFDIACISETYLGSSISSDYNSLDLPGYNLIGADNPTNTKIGVVCIYYYNYLPLKVSECIKFEIIIGRKMCSFLYLRKSASQTWDIFETFSENFELNFDSFINKNSFLIVALGDFNAKTTNWYKNDTNSYEGLKIDTTTSQFGLHQLITTPIHLTTNSSLYIDLIFISQPTFVMESGVHSSIHPNCYNQTVFAKFTNMKTGIMKRWMLAFFVDQTISSLGITYFLR